MKSFLDERNSGVIFNVSGGKVNITKGSGKVDAIMTNTESERSIMDL